MALLRRFARLGLYTLISLSGAGVMVTVATYLYVVPALPSTASLRDVRLQVPLRVYSREGQLIAEFGEMKRTSVTYEEVPELLIKAVLAAEDDRFFQHPGVDYQGILRAIFELIRTGEKRQGGSTITMQVARNFFLTSEKTYLRKLNEILLALRIERELSKAEILELYLNKIYLGKRAYGVAAAAQIYYGTTLDRLSVAQMAMIAGLPKAPSSYNPLANPARAISRRDYVLARMRDLGYISHDVYQMARAEPVTAKQHSLDIEVNAPYVAEMVRALLVSIYGEDAYVNGYNVFTTVSADLQRAANSSLRGALIEYDARHGYRGPEGHLEDTGDAVTDQWQLELAKLPRVGNLLPAVVTDIGERSITALIRDGRSVEVTWDQLSWARPYIDDNRVGKPPQTAGDILRRGDIIRLVALADNQWRLAQVPMAEGALVSINPGNGAIVALTGGFDFQRSKFNRVTQAKRQAGSALKPFIYSAALEKGFTPASLINDAPVVFEDTALESFWRPENYSGEFFGPTRLRVALTESRNLVSVRLLRAIGVPYAVDYLSRFAFNQDELPRNLSLALGSAAVTPLELCRAYATFANGGYLITPYFIDRVVGPDGNIVFQPNPVPVCADCDEGGQDADAGQGPPDGAGPMFTPAPRVISAQNTYLMTSMMRDVIQEGTARRARQLNRGDLAGKTGTTNDGHDAWFAGFNADIVTVSWVGFDQAKTLGSRETGGRAALPMWIGFMKTALENSVERAIERPPGLVTVRIDADTGLLAGSDNKNAIFETFPADGVPKPPAGTAAAKDSGTPGAGIPEQLF